jgi:hypothetical protein
LKLALSGAGSAKMSYASATASGSGFSSAKHSGSGKHSGSASANDSAYDCSKPSGPGIVEVSGSSKPSGSASSSAKSPKILPVTVLYVDVRQPSQLPFSPIHIDEMVRMGNFVLEIDFADMSKYAFKSLIKIGKVFSTAGKGYYLYGLKKLYTKILIPTSFHKKNYPGSAARTSICKGKFLIVSPSARNDEEKAAYLSLVTRNGEMILDEDSDQDVPIVAAPREVPPVFAAPALPTPVAVKIKLNMEDAMAEEAEDDASSEFALEAMAAEAVDDASPDSPMDAMNELD